MMKPSKRSISMLDSDSQQNASDTQVPPAHQKRRRTRHSGAGRLPDSESDVDGSSPKYTALELTEKPKQMDASKITTYIQALSEYTHWMDLFSLLTTNDEDCQHHLEILQKWRELRYPECMSYDMLNARPKRPTGSVSLGRSQLRTRICAVLTYKKLVDSATYLLLPELRREALMRLLDYLVMCYIGLDDAAMTDRLPDHVGMFDTAVFELSTARGSSHSYIRHATREIPPEIQSQAGTGGVPPEIILAAEGQGDRATDIEGLVKGIVMEPANYVGVPHWDQIVGNDDAKTLLWSHIITRRSFKQYFEEPASILLFGPPGTGKTSMVKSLARHAGFVCLEINGPMIKKKYFGETEAMVTRIFSHARAVAPCLIFLDEVEGTLSLEGITIAFLKCMSEVGDSGLEITIFATTNKPWKLSSAMLRRFTAKIYVSLPEKKHVLKLIKNSLKRLEQRETPSGRQPFTLEKAVLGETLDKLTTEFFRKPQERYLTGDEVVQSVNTIGETLLGAWIFKKEVIRDMEYILACSDIAEESAFEKPLSEFTIEESEMLRVRPINIEDVPVALNEFGSTTTGDSIKTFDDWYRAFGTGSKKKNKKNEDKQPNQPYRQRDGRTGDLARYLLNCLRNFGGNSELELARHLFDWLRDFKGDSRMRDSGVNLGRYLLDGLLDYR